MTTLRRYVRQVVAPNGKHRSRSAAVALDDLLGPEPAPPAGAVFVQAWDDCEPCGKATAGVLHKDGWTCGECLTSSAPDTATTTHGGTT
jgi:ribosomal protein S27AE